MRVMSELRNQLRSILLSVPGLPTVQWQGKTFNPSPDLPYVKERVEPVDSVTATWGQTGCAEETVIYSLNLYWPITGFVTDAEDMADAIRTAFWIGRAFVPMPGADICGSVRTVSLMPPVEGPVYNMYPIRVNLFIRRPLVMPA